MIRNRGELRDFLKKRIESMQLECNFEEFGESLDSLARLEIIEFLNSELSNNFDFLIIEPIAWETFEGFVLEVSRAMDN